MSAAPQETPEADVTFAPLDSEHEFTFTATIGGVTGTLVIRAQRVSTIAREIRLLKQNGMIVEQPQASSNGTNGTAEAPVCPDHQKPMKKGQYGWFCPRKTADGEYCKQRIK